MDKHTHAQHLVINREHFRAGKRAPSQPVPCTQTCIFNGYSVVWHLSPPCRYTSITPLMVILWQYMLPHNDTFEQILSNCVQNKTKQTMMFTSILLTMHRFVGRIKKNSMVKHEPVLHRTITLYWKDRICVSFDRKTFQGSHMRATETPIIRQVVKSSDALPNSCPVKLSCSVS